MTEIVNPPEVEVPKTNVVNSTLLERVKNSMRIDGEDHDEELSDLINAAKREMLEAGAVEEALVEDDELVRLACITYCKSHFGYDDDKGKFEAAFEKMLVKISLLTSYKGDANET